MSKLSIPASNASFDAQALREAVNQLLNGEQRSVRFNDLTGTGYFEWDPTGSLRVGKNFENMQLQVNDLRYQLDGFTTGYQALQSSVENIGGKLVAQSSDITRLMTHVELIRRRGDMIESRITADSRANRELLSRVTVSDSMIEALARDQVDLYASLAVGEGTMSFLGNEVIANASATAVLEARVTVNEDSIEAIASDIVDLKASVEILPRVFVQPEEPDPVSQGPFLVGDMWLDSDNSNKVHVWNGSEWGESAELAGATIYAQPTAPVSAGLRVGDLWFDTDDNNRVHRWDGINWIDVTNPLIDATAEATEILEAKVLVNEQSIVSLSQNVTKLSASVDTKNSTYKQPTPPAGTVDRPLVEGDLWLDTANGNILRRWNGSEWSLSDDKRVSDMADDGIISQVEKPQLRINYGSLVDEREGINAQADASEIVDEKQAYNGALDRLFSYMDSLTGPVPWDDPSDVTFLV